MNKYIFLATIVLSGGCASYGEIDPVDAREQSLPIAAVTTKCRIGSELVCNVPRGAAQASVADCKCVYAPRNLTASPAFNPRTHRR